jgi:hypothetical protein
MEAVQAYLRIHRYYCGSEVHVCQDTIKRYIPEQERNDVFDYNIFGDHN